MVGRIVAKRKRNPILKMVLRELAKLEPKLLRAIDGDIRVYKKVVAAYGLPKERKGRAKRIESALREGYRFQKEVAFVLLRAMDLCNQVGLHAKGSIASDLVLSGHFIRAAFLGACQTARVNAEYMKDRGFRKSALKTLDSLERDFKKAERK